jgi:GMP synthase (glutamine-hydrolysing)
LKAEQHIIFTAMSQQILILDFGSQYTQLIARRVRELNVYCEIHPFNKIPVLTPDIKGVILSGSPCSVRDAGSPDVDASLFNGKVPVLGLCYGAQLMAHKSGGTVIASKIREYGRAKLSTVDHHNELLKEISLDSQVWMSHADTINQVPDSFEIIASTPAVKVAAFRVKGLPVYGLQFHPGSNAYNRRKKSAQKFCGAHLRMCAGLDA